MVLLAFVVGNAVANHATRPPVEALPDLPPLLGAPPATASTPTTAAAATEPGRVELPPGVDPALQRALERAVGEREDISVVVFRPADGRFAAIRPEAEHYAASLFKLALLYEAGRRLGSGELRLDEPVYYDDEAFAEDLGTVGALEFDERSSVPLSAALEAMIARSDNASAVALLRLLGPAAVDATLARLGLSHTSVNTRELPTTAADMARLMTALVIGEGLAPAVTVHVRELLRAQQTRWGIPAGLPRGVEVGNKTGTWEGATHDVAFVASAHGDYVLAVLTGGSWDWEPIAAIAAAVDRELR